MYTRFLVRVVWITLLALAWVNAWAQTTVLYITAATASQAGTTGTYTVPVGGPYKYRITAKGARGGSDSYDYAPRGDGGLGATIQGEFTLNSGQSLEAIAGAPGENASFIGGGGGGGGSGIRLAGSSRPLLIAGAGAGGGGSSINGSIQPGNGQGGNGINGAGGGGLLSSGGTGFTNGLGAAPTGGGSGFNAVGGQRRNFNVGAGNGGGGYGGGGGGNTVNGGGGGGYSGGAGSNNFNGGGGGSINFGTNQTNTPGNNYGGGQVIVELLGPAAAFSPTLTANQPCGIGTGSLSIDLTGDFNNSTNSVEYAIVSGNTFSGSPSFTTITAEPLTITSGTGTAVGNGGSTYTVRVRVIYNPSIYTDYTYTLTPNANQPLVITAQPASGSGVCTGGSVSASVSVTGTVTGYQWYRNGQSLGNAQTTATLLLNNVQTSDAGSYSVLVTGACNNVTSTAFSLTVNPPPTNISLSSNGPLTCAQPSVTLTATGGSSYTFSAGATQLGSTNQATVSMAGLYSVTVANASGCTSTTSISVSEDKTPPSLTLSPTQVTLTCANPSATLTASGVGNVRWSDNSTNATLTVSTAGVYSVTLTGANGCSAMASTTVVGDQTPPTAGLTNDGPLSCLKTSVTLSASGGGTYRFSTGTSQIGSGNTASVTTAGTYSVTVTSANGCSAVATTTVVGDQTPPTAGLTDDGPLTCLKTSVTLTATGGGTYRFSTGATQIGSGNTATVNTAGVYSVTVTSPNGCTAVASTTVVGDQTPPTAGLTNDGPLSCTKTSVTLTATGGGTYAFSAGATQLGSTNQASVTTAGPYSVTVTSANGCTATATTTVNEDKTPPTASLSNNGPLSAARSSVTLMASPGGVAYAFSAGATQPGGSSGNTATVTTPGTYSVTITGANGCTATASTSVTTTATPTGPQTVCRNSRLVLTTARPAARYEWYKNGQTAANKLIDVASIQVGTTTASLTLVSMQTSATYYVKEIQATGSYTWSGPFSLTVDARCMARIGVEEPLSTLRVLVTPNPLEGDLLQATVEGAQGQPLTLQLVDLQGRTLYHQYWQEAEQKQTVSWSVSSQPAGVYLLQASTTTQRQTIKVVKP